MWANRITLDFIKHEDARNTIQNELAKIGANDDYITDLHISCDGGYVCYTVKLCDKTSFTVFDNGSVINKRK